MFNLLSKMEKESIRREYRLRLAVVVLCFSFATLVIAGALLSPSYFLSSQKEKAAERRFELLSKSVARGSAGEPDKVLQNATLRLSLLSHEQPRIYLHELLMKLAAEKGTRISLSNISIGGEAAGKRQVDIAGIAQDRAALVSYVKSLERSGLFENVEVPISNYAKNSDIGFSIRALVVF